ncbi:LysE family translocator [Cystobacter fuscus]|uniref:LysE family translocator n=1 Tax=Cystobacter fuscus TaxID=43 RepID=UPI002B315304|nr:LysE family translocator [Cystobacter fuscus]
MIALMIAMGAFSLTMSISPGPVNMVIVSSGANNGVRHTMPFVSGATIGFTLLLIFVGFWFQQMINAYPTFFMYLELAGSAFIIYVGYKIATSEPEISIEKRAVPTFMQGFLLQWLNPKAWIACASGAALFSSPTTHLTLVTFIVIYFVICYLSLAAWAVLGDRMTTLLKKQSHIRAFNVTMGGLLILSACYMVYMQMANHTV